MFVDPSWPSVLDAMGVVDATAFMATAFMATAFLVFIDVTVPLPDFPMADDWEEKIQTLMQKLRLEIWNI